MNNLFKMSVTKMLPIIAVSILILMTNKSFAVENGFEIKNDPNAVALNGSGGFLYSPRIVLTTAHNHLHDELSTTLVGLPGEPWTPNATKFTSKKTFLPSSFKEGNYGSGGNVLSRTDDFAVIVLDQPIQMRNIVKIATKEQIEQFKLK